MGFISRGALRQPVLRQKSEKSQVTSQLPGLAILYWEVNAVLSGGNEAAPAGGNLCPLKLENHMFNQQLVWEFPSTGALACLQEMLLNLQ